MVVKGWLYVVNVIRRLQGEKFGSKLIRVLGRETKKNVLNGINELYIYIFFNEIIY
jgi:hypothetical protein